MSQEKQVRLRDRVFPEGWPEGYQLNTIQDGGIFDGRIWVSPTAGVLSLSLDTPKARETLRKMAWLSFEDQQNKSV